MFAAHHADHNAATTTKCLEAETTISANNFISVTADGDRGSQYPTDTNVVFDNQRAMDTVSVVDDGNTFA